MKWWQRNGVEPKVPVVSKGFDVIVAYADLPVGVSDDNGERQVVVERGVGCGEVELSERGFSNIKLDCEWAEADPEDERGKKEYEEGDEGSRENAAEVAPET